MIPGFISNGSKTRLKVFGWYQILGGASGVFVTFWILAKTGQIIGITALLFLVAFTLYALSIYCGKLLLGTQYNKGLNLSIINQLLQTVSFAFMGYAYQYNSGAEIELKIAYGTSSLSRGFNAGVDFGLLSNWQLSIASNDLSFKLGINFLAIYLIYLINKLRIKLAHEKVNHEIAGIEPEI